MKEKKKTTTRTTKKLPAKPTDEYQSIDFSRFIFSSSSFKTNPEEAKYYRALVELAQDFIFIVDRNFLVRYVNINAAIIVRKKQEEIVGKRLDEFFPPPMAQRMIGNLQKVFDSRESLYIENKFEIAGGKSIWLDSRLIPIKEKDDRVEFVVGFSRDHSIRKETEEKLITALTSLTEFEAILNKSRSVIFLWKADINLTVENVSDNVMQFGYKPTDFTEKGKSYCSIIKPDYYASSNGAAKLSMMKDSATDAENKQTYCIVTRDGQTRWVEDLTWPVRDLEGRIVQFQGIITDITDRMIAEMNLKRSEDVYKTLVETTPCLICKLSPGGKTIFVNKHVSRMLGYKPEEVVGRNWWNLFYPDDLKYQVDELFRDYSIKDIRDYRMLMKAKNGETRSIIWNSFNIWDVDGNITEVNGVGVDITAQERLQLELGRTQKLQAVGQLAGGVAHEFNNILTMIKMYAELVQKYVPESSQAKQDVNEIIKASDHAASLTKQLLQFSRRQPMEMKPISINTVVTDMLKMLNRLIGDDIAIETAFDGNIPDIYADQNSIEQVIVNLVMNSRDAMPKGGKISISTKLEEFDGEYCKANSSAKPGKAVSLNISDTGSGIPDDIMPRLFEPFFTTKPLGKGSGLGLSMVYGIIKEHQGWITIANNPDHGVLVNIHLPLERRKHQTTRFIKGS